MRASLAERVVMRRTERRGHQLSLERAYEIDPFKLRSQAPRHEAVGDPPDSVDHYGRLSRAAIYGMLLDDAEAQLRWKNVEPLLDVVIVRGEKPGDLLGGGTGPNGLSTWHTSRELLVYRCVPPKYERDIIGRLTWPQAFRGLGERRRMEPVIAAARDLADAYDSLRYYKRAYGVKPPYGYANRQDSWTPWPLFDHLTDAIALLGGDPTAIITKADRRHQP
jgi:hypothetical protein